MNNYKNITLTFFGLFIFTLISTISYAEDNNKGTILAIGAKLGTTGFGIEGRSPIKDNLYGRLGVNYLNYNHSVGKKGALNYKGKLTLLSVPLMLDYHPFDNSGFRISLGVAYNGNKFVATAKPNKSVNLYGNVYTPQDLGTVKSKLTPKNKVAPILTIGYDGSFISKNPWSFNAEAGVMYSGKTKLKISATGLARQQPTMLNDLNREANKNLNKVKKYLEYFPIFSIGFKYNL